MIVNHGQFFNGAALPAAFTSPALRAQLRARLLEAKVKAAQAAAAAAAPSYVIKRALPSAVEEPARAPDHMLRFGDRDFGYDPARPAADLPAVQDPGTSSIPTPGAPALSFASLFPDLNAKIELMKPPFNKPSFWMGSAAFVGLISFLAFTNNGGSGRHAHKRRR